MKLLPDLLESVARLRVKVSGTFKGARREINFTSSDSSVTITGTDDSVNERMTVDLVAASGGAVGPTVFFTATQVAIVTGSEQTYAMTWSAASDGRGGAVLSPPTGFGLSFTLNGIVTAFTATEAGTWFVSAFTLANLSANDDYVYVSANGSSSDYSLFDVFPWRASFGVAGFAPEADGHAVFTLEIGDTIIVSAGYLSTAGTAATQGGAQITRLG